MISPETAPPRTDLPWLRHRSSRPRPAPATRAAAPDLALPPPADLSLDLPSPAATPAVTPAPTPAPVPNGRRRPERLPYPRVQPGATAVLARPHPTVTLTRLQSGVGQLAVALRPVPGAGDVEMGVLCETDDGALHVVQRLGDRTSAPAPGSPLPLVRLAREDGADVVLVDLRSVRRLRRALFYGYSPSVSVVTWDGVVRAVLHDGGRLEAPFDLPPLSGTVALLTLYVVDGEVVVRAEMEPFAGPPETAALAYGYRLGWLDGRLPAP